MAADHSHLSRAALGPRIESVEARLYQRRIDTRRHAAVVGDRLSEAMTSPYTLVGAVGLGFAVAWFYPRRRDDAPDSADAGAAAAAASGEDGTSALATIMSGLNLAGMVLSMFPPSAPQEENTDPR